MIQSTALSLGINFSVEKVIAESIPMFIIEEKSGLIVFANKALLKITQSSSLPADLCGMNIEELIPQSFHPIKNINNLNLGLGLNNDQKDHGHFNPLFNLHFKHLPNQLIDLYHKNMTTDQTKSHVLILVMLKNDNGDRTKTEPSKIQSDHLNLIFSALIENSSDFIGIADHTGKPIYVNPAGRKLIGMPKETNVEETTIPQYYPLAQREFASQVIVTEMVSKGYWKGETYFRHWQTEESIPVSDTHFMIYHPIDGQLLGMGTITRDITDLKEAEQGRLSLIEEKSKREEAEKNVDLRDEFISIASHELKNPLTALKLQFQLISPLLKEVLPAEAAKKEKINETFEWAHKQLNVIIRLVDDLLDVTRLTSGHLVLDLKPTDLSLLIRQVLDKHQLLIKEYNSPITTNCPAGIIGQWDAGRIEQVVMNLLTNAMKYGRGNPIKIECDLKNDQAMIRVTDHGIGLSAEEQLKIFQRFERARWGENIQGLGLGLYIADQIVKAHGGNIRVQSELNHGSVFTVELPLNLPLGTT